MDEAALIRLYTDLTGSTESQARNVFMHLCCNGARRLSPSSALDSQLEEIDQPQEGALQPLDQRM
jgi:hypothetical protein